MRGAFGGRGGRGGSSSRGRGGSSSRGRGGSSRGGFSGRGRDSSSSRGGRDSSSSRGGRGGSRGAMSSRGGRGGRGSGANSAPLGNQSLDKMDFSSKSSFSSRGRGGKGDVSSRGRGGSASSSRGGGSSFGAQKSSKSTEKPMHKYQKQQKKEEEEYGLEDVEVKDFDEEERAEEDEPMVSDGVANFANSDDDKEDDDSEEENEERKKKKKKKSGGFQSLGLNQPVFRAILRKGFRVPTPIQRKTMPIIMQGEDVVAMARTGSGKTAAFVIPMLEKLKEHTATFGIRAVILSPTRELAVQTHKVVKELGCFTDLRFCCLTGGESMEDQFEQLSRNPDVLIATPGRLFHQLMETGMSLKSVEYIVFDEADRLFEMGFADQIKSIMSRVPDRRQTLLFSATLPAVLVEFARAGLKTPQIIRLDVDSKLSENLDMSFLTVRHEDKTAALLYLLNSFIPAESMTIVFCASKHHVEYLHELLEQFGFVNSYVYGSMDPLFRKINVDKFRKGVTKLMVVTDLAARGIDIPMLDNVINYDFPARAKLFVHRVGRAARAGRSGTAYSIVAADEVPYMVDLHLFLGRPLVNQRPQKPEGEDEDDGPKFGESEPTASEKTFYFGAIPQPILDDLTEGARQKVFLDSSLESLQTSMLNSYKVYFKTRGVASRESMRRAKELNTKEIHPDVLDKVGIVEKHRNDFLHQMKQFRPKQTVFEDEKKMDEKQAVVMKAVRQDHARTIEQTRLSKKLKQQEQDMSRFDSGSDDEGMTADQLGEVKEMFTKAEESVAAAKAAKSKPKSYRDEKFFLPYQREDRYDDSEFAVRDRGTRLEDYVVEMAADEEENSLFEKKRKTVWDASKKNFVTQDIDQIRKERIAKKDKSKVSAYETWQKRTGHRIQTIGEKEEEDSAPRKRPRRSDGDDDDEEEGEESGQRGRGGFGGGRGRSHPAKRGRFGGDSRGDGKKVPGNAGALKPVEKVIRERKRAAKDRKRISAKRGDQKAAAAKFGKGGSGGKGGKGGGKGRR